MSNDPENADFGGEIFDRTVAVPREERQRFGYRHESEAEPAKSSPSDDIGTRIRASGTPVEHVYMSKSAADALGVVYEASPPTDDNRVIHVPKADNFAVFCSGPGAYGGSGKSGTLTGVGGRSGQASIAEKVTPQDLNATVQHLEGVAVATWNDDGSRPAPSALGGPSGSISGVNRVTITWDSPPAGIVEACGCEESISLAEQVELFECLVMDTAVAAGLELKIDAARDLVEHVRQLAANCAASDRSEEIASLTRALEAERAGSAANQDAVYKAARLTLHNRMLLGLVESLAAAPDRKPESVLARARSLCAEGLEIAQFVTGIGKVAAFTAADLAVTKLSDALGWAAVGTY